MSLGMNKKNYLNTQVVPGLEDFFDIAEVGGLQSHTFTTQFLSNSKFDNRVKGGSDCVDFGVKSKSLSDSSAKVSICYTRANGARHDLSVILEGVMNLLTQRCLEGVKSSQQPKTDAKPPQFKRRHRLRFERKQKSIG